MSHNQKTLEKNVLIYNRVVPDTDLAGYPAYNFAGYRISGWPDDQISDRISG